MTHDPRCPSCGHVNAIDDTRCTQCNFPLHESAPAAAEPPAAIDRPERPERPEAAISMERIRPLRPRRAKPPGDSQKMLMMQLWGAVGVLAVLAVLYTAYKGFQKNNAAPPVAGASVQQQQQADVLRGEIARDSTNLNAQVQLGDLLYDTANWPEAIVHYKTVLRLDPKRVGTMVDLGVCYYNLSQPAPAESLWNQALAIDPNLGQAMFNLGLLSENDGNLEKALQYYHSAMRTGTLGNGQQLSDAIARVSQKLGRKAPALPQGANGMPAMPPGGGK